MIGLALIVTAAIAYWAWKTRDGQAMRIGDVAAVVAALIGLKLLRGEAPLGILALAGAGWWYWFRRGGPRPASAPMTREEARRLLGVSIDATTDEIRAAHRRLIARVHPDTGGSADLSRQVNLARDTLLRYRG